MYACEMVFKMIDATRDQFQVAAFQLHWKLARQAGDDILNAFMKAVVQTSNDATSRALDRDPGAVERWYAISGRYNKYR